MQLNSTFAKAAAIGAFRRDLRVLERELVRQLEGETACCGVTLAQCHALLELSFSELSLSGLAAAVDLDTSTLCRTVDGLVKVGLVERTEDSADRRSIRLVLSAAGRAKVATIDEMCNRYYTELFEQLSDKDQLRVIRAVGLLAGLMRSRRCAPDSRTVCCETPRLSARRGRRSPTSRKAGKEGSR
jgi:DNA-binding MarR family transcriptional regulator